LLSGFGLQRPAIAPVSVEAVSREIDTLCDALQLASPGRRATSRASTRQPAPLVEVEAAVLARDLE